MGPGAITGTILIITGWFALVEFDHFPESKRQEILQTIKRSPSYIILIALMPAGILVNMIGVLAGSYWVSVAGASLIFLQGIIVSLLFWKRKRWKSILLLIVIIVLGVLMYTPLFMR